MKDRLLYCTIFFANYEIENLSLKIKPSNPKLEHFPMLMWFFLTSSASLVTECLFQLESSPHIYGIWQRCSRSALDIWVKVMSGALPRWDNWLGWGWWRGKVPQNGEGIYRATRTKPLLLLGFEFTAAGAIELNPSFILVISLDRDLLCS